MHPARIDVTGDLLEKQSLPRLPRRRLGAIRGAVTPDNEDVRTRSRVQYARQGAHKDVIPAERLEIARGERDHFVCRCENPPRREAIGRVWIRRSSIDVHPLVNDRDPVLIFVRLGGALPRGG